MYCIKNCKYQKQVLAINVADKIEFTKMQFISRW